ncbi:hypothetical protein [Amycolatopsis sp. DG1A-15b]|uniref:hypothetical protein n=1 Tax=Amycolatopsis sp. DG1A-15b TaxID=3052846 RepID=UPI00255B492A|nr:hypothetical protein [Amycolatopsis sp. DG1A-15b]WIX89658.1 hypothetical protein QRY02_04195 [Amycolatopsis sp. DG1A-15b]
MLGFRRDHTAITAEAGNDREPVAERHRRLDHLLVAADSDGVLGYLLGWAARRNCALSALATRRATPFYLALGDEESATYLRKVLPTRELP